VCLFTLFYLFFFSLLSLSLVFLSASSFLTNLCSRVQLWCHDIMIQCRDIHLSVMIIWIYYTLQFFKTASSRVVVLLAVNRMVATLEHR
jgi:hypothetical protein